MKKPEDWVEPVAYEIRALSLRKSCRSGIEPGDCWQFEWNTPAGFCPKTLMQVFPLMIACECSGDLRERGGTSQNTIEFTCPDGEVKFRLTATRGVPTIASRESEIKRGAPPPPG